jgi:hypothetical protein
VKLTKSSVNSGLLYYGALVKFDCFLLSSGGKNFFCGALGSVESVPFLLVLMETDRFTANACMGSHEQ